jgi:hypothetical protein
MMSDPNRRAERAEACAVRELAAVPNWIWDGKSLPVPVDSIAEDHYGLLVQARPSLAEFATSTDVHVSGVLLRANGRILVDGSRQLARPGDDVSRSPTNSATSCCTTTTWDRVSNA